MQNVNSKPLSLIIFIPLAILISIRPFFSGLAHFTLETFYETALILISIAGLVLYKKRDLKTSFLIPILVLLAAHIVSHIFSVNHTNSTQEIIKLISLILPFSIILLSSDRQKETLIKVIVYSSIIISFYGIYQYFWGYDLLLRGLDDVSRLKIAGSSYAKDILMSKRAIATFPSPTIFGSYLVIMFFLALHLAKKQKMAIVAAIFISIALLLTKSMGAWLVLIFGLAVYLATSYNSIKHKKILIPLFSILIALALTFILITRWERLMNLENPQNSITQRINYWKTSIKIIKDYPLTGVGPGNFQEVFLKYKVGQGTDARYAHNLILQTWAEIGVLGLAGLLCILLILIKAAKKRPENILLLVSSLAFISHNMIDITYFIPQVVVFFWIISAISFSDPLLLKQDSCQI
ncbi:MAG: O-antigen ligase family protein [Candidatus Omnitrophota bacterium]